MLPALIRRYEEAKAGGAPEVTNWGTGTPRRELLHVDDLAGACLHLLEHYDGPSHVNVGTGIDHTIAEIAEMVAHSGGLHAVKHAGTQLNRTARRASCWMCRFCARPDGSPELRCKRVSG